MKSGTIIWVDLETTGLDPEKDQILEIAAVATNWELRQISAFHSLVHCHAKIEDLHDAVIEMHSKNGLFDDCEKYGEDADVAESNFIEWLVNYGHQSPMGGASVHFDRAFLKKHMPGAEKRFHYRDIDVSTLGQLVGAWYPERKWSKDRPHRAMDDILDTIEECRHYKALFDAAFAKGGASNA